jgi:hypothetical protein
MFFWWNPLNFTHTTYQKSNHFSIEPVQVHPQEKWFFNGFFIFPFFQCTQMTFSLIFKIFKQLTYFSMYLMYLDDLSTYFRDFDLLFNVSNVPGWPFTYIKQFDLPFNVPNVLRWPFTYRKEFDLLFLQFDLLFIHFELLFRQFDLLFI